MQRDFWVKNGVLRANEHAKAFWVKNGVWGKWVCKGIFWLKMGFERKWACKRTFRVKMEFWGNRHARGLLGRKWSSGEMAMQRNSWVKMRF